MNKVTKEMSMSIDMILALESIKAASVVAKKMWEMREVHMSNDFMRNIHLRKDGSISFLPKGKESEVAPDGSKWMIKNRQVCKPGVFARKWAKEWLFNFYDKDIELFSNMITAQATASETEIKLVSGNDIVKYYHVASYVDPINENTGTLAGSCMRHSSNKHLIQFYADNPHKIQLAVLFSKVCKTKIAARALVWKTNLGYFMDRIYGSDVSVKLFHAWAKKQKFMYKGMNDRTVSGNLITPAGREMRLRDLYVSDLKIPKWGENLPYLDTMCYIYANLGVLSPNSELNNGWGLLGVNQNQNGTPETFGTWSDKYETWLPQDYIAYAYKSYKDYQRMVGDTYPKIETFLCEGVYYHNSCVTVAWGGKLYPEDHPRLKKADGEKMKIKVVDLDTVVNFHDGKRYLRNTHEWVTLHIIDPMDRQTTINVLDIHAEEFLKKWNLTKNEYNEIKIPKTFSDFFQSPDGNEKLLPESPASGDDQKNNTTVSQMEEYFRLDNDPTASDTTLPF